MSYWTSNLSTNSKGSEYTNYGFGLGNNGTAQSQEENKTNRIASGILQNSATSTPSAKPLSISASPSNTDILGKTFAEAPDLSDKDLQEIIKHLQSIQLERAQKNNKVLDLLKTHLRSESWDKLKSEIEATKKNSGDLVLDHYLKSLESEFCSAVFKACRYGYDEKAMDAIYFALKDSTVLLKVIEEMLSRRTKEYSPESNSADGAIHYLLKKDPTNQNTLLIGARSKVILDSSKKTLDLAKTLKTGPIFFLSHGPDALKYDGYSDDRRKFFEYLEKYNSYQLIDVFGFTPQPLTLEPDLAQTFTTMVEKDKSIKWDIIRYVRKYPDTKEKQELLISLEKK